MKIAAAQTWPVTGDITLNIADHEKFVTLAATHGADLIIFPELSLTGYEPTLASALAITPEDKRLATFQKLSDEHKIAIGVGIPVRTSGKPTISLLLFQPTQPLQRYSKKYLHPDEEPFFSSGENLCDLHVKGRSVALAICYEISVADHARSAALAGASVYIASVAKFESGVAKACNQLSEIAAQHKMTVLMANSVGLADGQYCAGNSAAWNTDGAMVGNLDNQNTGLLILDVDNHLVTTII